jgi:hypothetical protein
VGGHFSRILYHTRFVLPLFCEFARFISMVLAVLQGPIRNPRRFWTYDTRRGTSIRAQEVVRNAGTWEQEHGEIDSSGKGELAAIEIIVWRRGQGGHEQEYDSAWAFGV